MIAITVAGGISAWKHMRRDLAALKDDYWCFPVSGQPRVSVDAPILIVAGNAVRGWLTYSHAETLGPDDFAECEGHAWQPRGVRLYIWCLGPYRPMPRPLIPCRGFQGFRYAERHPALMLAAQIVETEARQVQRELEGVR